MPGMLILGGAAALVLLVVLVLALMRRPARGDDTDRFINARRITTTWAADAGTDLAHPAPGQPGKVETTPPADQPTAHAGQAEQATAPVESAQEPGRSAPTGADGPADPTKPVVDLRRPAPPSRRPPR